MRCACALLRRVTSLELPLVHPSQLSKQGSFNQHTRTWIETRVHVEFGEMLGVLLQWYVLLTGYYVWCWWLSKGLYWWIIIAHMERFQKFSQGIPYSSLIMDHHYDILSSFSILPHHLYPIFHSNINTPLTDLHITTLIMFTTLVIIAL